MRKTLIIAWREFRATVFRKVFLLGVLGIPALMVVIGIIGGILVATHEPPALVGQVIVVDEGGDFIEAARAEFSDAQLAADQADQIKELVESAQSGAPPVNPGASMSTIKRGVVQIEVEREANGDAATLDTLRERLRDGDLLAVAVVPDAILDPPAADAPRAEFDLYVSPDLDSDHTRLIERRLGKAAVRVRSQRAGLAPEQALALLQSPRASTRRMLETGEEASEGEGTRVVKEMIPVFFMMLLWIGTFAAGQHLMMSTIEEKSTRVMEVLLSAVSALQLMTGKIIGQGGVGLVIVSIYSSLAIAALIAFAFMHLIDPLSLVYLAVYFFMAYFMVASAMAAVGSAVSDLREANTLMTPVMIVLMIPLILWMPISNDPNGILATIFSFIPPAIPFAMILRVVADEPVPAWQIPVTIAWGYLCVIGMVWAAAKVFRVGVLMYGKPPSPLELIRWIRRA